MSAKRTKEPQRKVEPRRDIVDQLLAANIASLRDSPRIPPGAASLARQILALVAERPARLTAEDTLLGATTAAVLAAFSCGMPRSDFVSRLRCMADGIEAEGVATEARAISAVYRRAPS